MMIGFGSTEIETARAIIGNCLLGDCESIREVLENIKAVQVKHKDQGSKNDKMNRGVAPSRYTTFYGAAFEIYEKFWLVTFDMSHINRDHALSPDGWAMLQTKWIVTIEDGEVSIFKQA